MAVHGRRDSDLGDSTRGVAARRHRFAVRIPLLIATASLLLAGAAAGQTGWDASLIVDPFPPAYLSDWELNPTLAALTITNGTGRDANVTIHFTIAAGDGRVVVSGRSEAQSIPPGIPTTYNTGSSLAGTSDYDTDLENLIARTGRFPEDDYTACVTLTDAGGFVVADNVCADFSTVYPDPPYQLFPIDGDTVPAQDPIFEWTPVQVPVTVQPFYVIQIAEILPGQPPYQALTSNILHYENPGLFAPALQYPLGALPFEQGKRYAWWVQALAQDGFPLSTNQGRSEIWTFTYLDPAGGDPGGEDIDGSVKATLVHTSRAGGSPLASLGSASYESIRATFDNLESGELRIPLPVPDLGVFSGVPLSNVRVDYDDGSRAIAITATASLPLGSVNLLLLGMWDIGDAGSFTLGIEPAAFDLSEWVSRLAGTPLGELDLNGSILTLGGTPGTLDASVLPLAVEQFYGTSTISVDVGVSLQHVFDLDGTTIARKLARVGIDAGEAELAGTISLDPIALFGSPGADPDVKLDLTATLRGANLADTPDWLSVVRYAIRFTNDPDIAVAAEIEATAELPNRTLAFVLGADLNTSDTDPDIVLTGNLTTPWDGPFGIAWLTLDQVTLTVTPADATAGTPASGVLSGRLLVGQKPVMLSVALEGSGDDLRATLTATVDELGIADFLSFIQDRFGEMPFAGQIPGDLAALTDVSLVFRSGDPATVTLVATATALGQSTDILYTLVPADLIDGDKPGGLFGIRLRDWSLGNIIPALQGNPLGDFRFPAVSFVLGPQGVPAPPDDAGGGASGAGGWSIPWSSLGSLALDFLKPSYPCAGGTGCGGSGTPDDDGSSLSLKPGLNFSAPISFSTLTDLFGDLFAGIRGGTGGNLPPGEDDGGSVVFRGSPGISLSNLFSGEIDLSGLLDISGVLPPLPDSPFGWPDWLSPGAMSIEILRNPDVRVLAHVELDADLDGPKTFDLTAEATNAGGGGGGGGAAFEGTMRGTWAQPFGLQWLTLDSVFVALSAGTVGPRVALASAFAIGTVEAALGIDVRGTSENRVVDFTASTRNLSTTDVVAFLNDAFGAGLAPPADPVTLDSLSIAFTTGDAASFDLSGGFSTGMDPMAALAALVDLLPGVSAPDALPFEVGSLSSAWFDLHVVPDSVWGGFGGRMVMGGSSGDPNFEGEAAIRLGGSRTGGGDWLALELDLVGRDLPATDAIATVASALPGDWSLPDGFGNTTLDSAWLRLATDSRTDSTGAEFAGAGRYAGGTASAAASLTLGLFNVADASWARGALTIALRDVPVSGALTQAAELLPGDWSLPGEIDALAPVQLDSASLAVGFDSRVDSISATVLGDGTMGGAGGLAASAALVLARAADESWASGRVDIRIGELSIPEALAQAATLLPGDFSLPSAVSGLAPLTLDSATLGIAFDTRASTFSAAMTGASHLGEGATRLDGSTELTLLLLEGDRIVRGRVTLTVVDLALTGLLAQTAALLPGDWSLPDGFAAFDALRLDSAELEVGFDTRADSVSAHAFGTGGFGDEPMAFGATADMTFARLGDASGARGTVELARSSLTMTQAIEQVANMLPGNWSLPDGLDAFNAIALDTARLELGFDTWTNDVYAGLWGRGGFDGLTADARLDFTQTPGGSRTTGLMTLSLGAVGAGDALSRIAGLLPGSWSLPSGFGAFNALSLDSASLHAGFDTQGDSLFAGFQGGGRLNDVNAEARVGFARIADASYGDGLMTLDLGDVSLSQAFNRVTGLLPGDWPVPSVDFDIGALRDVGLELGFDTRTDSVWAGVRARATLANRDGRASLDVISVGGSGATRSWVTGKFQVDVGDVTLPGALSLASSLVPGAPQVPTLDFDLGGISDAVLEAGFKIGDGDSAWAGLSGGFRLGSRTGRADLGLTLGSSRPSGYFRAAFDDRFGVSDIVELFTGFLPGGGIELPPLGPLDVGLDDALLEVSFGERTGISLGGSTQLFGKTANALFSAARINGTSQLIFGVQVPDLGFGDIVPGFDNPVTDRLRLALAALTLTRAEGEVDDEDLSPAERRFFRPLMGGLDDFTVEFNPGLNLTGLIPLAGAGAMKDMVDMLTPGASNLTLQGTIPLPGFGGGLRDLALRAALPPMAPPGKPAWFVEGEIAVQITGRPSVGVAGALTLDIDGDTLTFDIESNVAIIPAGGVELSIAGGLAAKRPWVGPLGINWLTLNEIRLALGLSPIAVRLGFLGDVVLGTKDIRVALGTKINLYTGVPIGAIVAGKSEAGLSLGDLISVADAIAGVGGGDPIPTDGVPDMAVRDLDIKVATYDDPDIDVEAGFTMKGAFFLQTQRNGPLSEFGRIELDVGLQGITGLARLSAFSLGPVSFDEALIDLALTIPDQHLIIQGGATIENAFSADLALAMSRDSFSFATDFDLFDLFRANMRASAGFDVLNPTFAIRVALYPEFLDQLTMGIARDLIPVGQGVLIAAAATLEAAQVTLNGAEAALDAALWAASEGARLAMNGAYSSYRSASNSYNYANGKYRYYSRKCSWRRPWACGKKSYWYGVRGFWSSQKSIRYGIYIAARTVYYNRQYLQNNPVVNAAERALADARRAFNAAQLEVNRMRASLNQLQAWMDTYDSCAACPRPPIPVSVISAGFEAALGGFFGESRVQLDLTYQVFGNRRTLRAGFGGSPTELVQPLFNAVSNALF